MIDLTNREEIRKLDPKNVFDSNASFADQCQQMVDMCFGKEFYSPEYKKVKNIVLCGMGGSAYGGHIAQSLFAKNIKVPLIVNSDYHLPGFVNEESLILCVSYSGSTEEVLSCFEEAKSKNLKITGFSSGGKLGALLKDVYPGFVFDAQYNPSNQPRLGTGYIVIGTFILLASLGVISISKEDLEQAIAQVRSEQKNIDETARMMAPQLLGFMPVVFAAEHLVGNAHIIRNQFNETSKSFSAYEDIPELNHHLMEGLKNPADKKLKALFFGSEFYSPIIKKRMELTKDVIKQNNIDYLEFAPKGTSALSEVLQTLAFGGYLTLYLGLAYGLDPSLIPWVDYFKAQLAK